MSIALLQAQRRATLGVDIPEAPVDAYRAAASSNGSMGLKHVALVMAGIAVGAAIIYSIKGNGGRRENPRRNPSGDAHLVELAASTRSEEAMEGVLKSKNREALDALAANPHAPLRVLRALVEDGFWREVYTHPRLVKARKSMDAEARRIDADIAVYADDQVVLGQLVKAWPSPTPASVRQSVAGNSFTSPDTLASMVLDESEGVRLALVHNSNTPAGELCWLIDQDNDASVREAAKFALGLRLCRSHCFTPSAAPPSASTSTRTPRPTSPRPPSMRTGRGTTTGPSR